jgi:TRAP transporter TAXI family solute receptor
MKKTVLTGVMLLTLAALFLAAPAPASELKPTTLTWVAGGVGGGWYVQAGGIARMITEKEPKIIIKVVPGGGVVNPVRISKGKDDLGWGITFVDKMAFKGMAPIYKKPNPDVRSMGGIFGIYHIHFVAAKGIGDKSLADLAAKVKAGKAVKVAAPMKGTSDLPLVENILGFYGISLDAIKKAGGKVIQAVYADMVNLYKDAHVDYVFTHLAVPGAAVTEMAVSRDSTLLSVSDACIDKLHQDLGTLSKGSGRAFIPKGSYKGQAGDVPAVVTAGELLANKNLDPKVAYTIMKIICENIDELHKINKANKNFQPKTGGLNVALPLHKGAEAYYKEKGYLK